jgi:predicted MFS family arabinose efflux permease
LYTVNECLDGKNKASALGTFDISFYAAIGIGPFLGGLLKDMFGFKGVVAALIILCVFSLVLLVAFVPQHKTKQNDDVCFITKKSIFTNNRLISLYIFIFGRGFIIATTCSFLPILLTVKYGLSSSAVGFIMTCSTAVMVLFLRQAGKLADRISPLLLILFGGAAVSLTYVLIPLISGFYNFIILFSLIGIFSIVSQPASTLILVKESKKENLCTATGYLSSFMGLGVASGIVVGSVVMKMANINLVFFTASLVGFFTVLLASAAYSMSVVGRSVSLYNTESKEI